MLPEDQIYKLYRIAIPTEFALSRIGQILLLLSYTLEGPVIFILLIATNIIAIYSFKKFNDINFQASSIYYIYRELSGVRKNESELNCPS